MCKKRAENATYSSEKGLEDIFLFRRVVAFADPTQRSERIKTSGLRN